MTQEQYDQLVEIANKTATTEDVERLQTSLTLDFHLKYQILQNRKIELWQEKEKG